MILTCTSCSTRYYADDAAIGPTGRTVRCAACGTSWFAEPQLELRATDETAVRGEAKPEPLTRERVERLRRAATQPGPAPSAAAKFRAQQAERMRRDRSRAAVAAWTATGAALAASATGMVVFRQDVAELWPRSASAFAALGLDVNVYGLEFYDLSVERAFDGPTPILLVSGEVRNIGRDEKQAPPVRLSLRDQQSHEIFELVHAVTDQPIAAGAAVPFQIRVENPPADAVDLEATFASFSDATFAGGPAHVSPPVTEQPPLELTEPLDEHGAGDTEPSAQNDGGPIEGLAPRFTAG
ncbi:MJ0042-type zinc finger domain-containing protein [Terricaulis sp.]|uniref:MJ0042-type zinc finger domain-containing protein n=1 Tax=Terricaulis sp. TaxID=2768686 RepID=UPI003783FD1C